MVLQWGMYLVGYLFLGGLSGGAYIIGSVADLLGKKTYYRTLSKTGIYLSIPAILLGTVLLIIDLGRFDVNPFVPLNAFIHFPVSILSVGTVLISFFTIISITTAILWFYNGPVALRKIVEAIGLLFGGAAIAYTGLLLAFSRGHSFWQSGFLPWLFVSSGIITGVALTLVTMPIISIVAPRVSKDLTDLFSMNHEYANIVRDVRPYIQILGYVELAILILFMATNPVTWFILTNNMVSTWFYAYLVMGFIIPLTLGYLSMHSKSMDKYVVRQEFSAYILILVAGFILRYIVLTAGQLIP